MALQPLEVAIAFGQGLDKKTDPKAVVPGKFLTLENAVFTEGHQIAKRPGYDAMTNKTFSPITFATGTLVAPKMIKAYNNETLCQDSGRLYSYSTSLGAWIDKGPYECVEMTQQQISANAADQDQTFQTCCLSGNYLVLAYQQSGFNHATGATLGADPYVSVVDISSGVKIYGDKQLDIAAQGPGVDTQPRAVLLGGTVPAVVYINASQFPTMRALTIGSNQVTLGAKTTIYSSSSQIFDCVATATGGVMLLAVGGTDLVIKTFDTTGTVTHSATIISGASFQSPGALCVDPTNGNIWAYWAEDSGGGYINVYYAVFSSTLGVVLARTNAVNNTGTTNDIGFLVANAVNTTNQILIYNGSQGGTTAPLYAFSKNLTSAGVSTNFTFKVLGLAALSRIFTVNSMRYLYMVEANQQSSSVFLVGIDSNRFSPSTANYTGTGVGKALTGDSPILPGTAAVSTSGLNRGLVGDVVSYSSTKKAFHVAYVSDTVDFAGNTIANRGIHASTLLFCDFNSQDAFQGKIFAGTTVLNGGIPSLYDSQICAELSFNNIPAIYQIVDTSTGGLIHDGTYSYTIVFQWTDNLGNIYQSEPSAPLVKTVSDGTSTTNMAVYASIPILSHKDPFLLSTVTIFVYRTTNNGTLYFQTASRAANLDPTQGGSIIINDGTPDSTLTAGKPLYTTGSVLGNSAPPPSMLIASHNNRLWAVDSTNQNNIAYTKTNQRGVGISFSDNLLYEIDPRGDSIGALQELDDKLITFKKNNAILAIFGDGANDAGAGATLGSQFIQTDVGCSVSKSIISQPNGIMFKSPKGWYLLDRSTQVSYIGSPVETYNSQDVTSAVRLPDKTLCVFLTSSGSTLAYDYFFNQWSTFTNHAGYSADICNGLYTYARTDNSIFTQNSTSYLDSATSYLLRGQTSWLRLDKIQGFQRARQVFSLGDHLSPATGHGIQISAAYDFEQSFGTPVVYTFSGTGDYFQYRQHLARQKCDTVSLLIEEVSASAGASGEYIDLTDLGFDAAVKKGPNKLPSAQSVG